MYVILVLALLATGCAYELPTQPSTVAQAVETRVPTQMIVKVVGPTGWWTDRIVIDAYVLDERGATLPTVVACDTSQGHLEPRQWDTASRSGVTWFATQPGASFTCRAVSQPGVSASYVTAAIDFEMPRGCCGAPIPAPKPPVVPVPDPDDEG